MLKIWWAETILSLREKGKWSLTNVTDIKKWKIREKENRYLNTRRDVRKKDFKKCIWKSKKRKTYCNENGKGALENKERQF